MADGDLERRLGEVLRERAGGFTPSADLPTRIGTRTRQRAHNRRVALSAAAAVVLVAVAAPIALSAGDGDDDSQIASRVAASDTTTAAAEESAADEVAPRVAPTTTAAGGADTTAAGTADADTAVPPPAAQTTAAADGVYESADGAPPPFLLAVMPGDNRVALVSTQTGDVVRSVENSAQTGAVFSDDDGSFVFRADGCGTVGGRTAAVAPGTLATHEGYPDAAAFAEWDDGSTLIEFATVRDGRCHGADGPTLAVTTPAGNRSLPVPYVGGLSFSVDGTTLVWSQADGVVTLDVTDPDSTPSPPSEPDPRCPVVALSFITGSQLAVVTQCPGETARVFTFDAADPSAAPREQGPDLSSFSGITDVDYAPTGQWMLVSHEGGVDVVSAVTGETFTTIRGAHSAHWTTATG